MTLYRGRNRFAFHPFDDETADVNEKFKYPFRVLYFNRGTGFDSSCSVKDDTGSVLFKSFDEGIAWLEEGENCD